VVRQISTRPKDEVLAQTLAAGAQVARDSTIGLAVSDGPGTLVPDVIGLTETVAGRTITAAGLQSLVMFRVQGSEPAGTVVGQRPGAGERLAGGGTVGLTVSTGSGGGQLPL
jgi:beta-lactam-binding protein with PASTA domain